MEKKKLIAIITNNDDDIYCFRKELIEAFLKQNYEILISCPYGPKFELMKDIKYYYDNPSIDRRGMNFIADFKLLLHYKKMLKKFKPDVVLTYTAKPNVYASLAAKLLKIPYINNVTGLGSVLNKSKYVQKFILFLFGLAYKNAACIMFQNEANMNMIKQLGLVRGDYKLIPGSGVNTSRFILQEYPNGGNGIEGEPVIFNYIGRILHDKGVDDYLNAAKIIKSKYPKTEFNLIGFVEPTESHYNDELKKLEEEGIISYRGSQKDVRPFIKRSHAIIHPSTYGEGMSNVLLENASSGRVIITTDNVGCKETVLNNKTGFVYRSGNVEELVKKIEDFLQLQNDKRHLMGKDGRKYIEENFSRNIVIREYLNSIEKITRRI